LPTSIEPSLSSSLLNQPFSRVYRRSASCRVSVCPALISTPELFLPVVM